MSEEEKTEKVKEEIKEEPKGEKPEKKSIDDLQNEIEKLSRSLENKTEEAQRVHKKLEEYEKAEDEKKQAEMTEMEKLQAQIIEKETALSEREHELEQLKLNEKKRQVAEEVGLPAPFALRIQGVTPEEMKTDAQALLDAMPKVKPTISPTNPGQIASEKEARGETARRLGLVR